MHPGLSLTLQNAANEAFKKLLIDKNLSERLADAKLEFARAVQDCHLETVSPHTNNVVKTLIAGEFRDIQEQAELTKAAIEAVLREKVIDEASPDFLTKGSFSG